MWIGVRPNTFLAPMAPSVKQLLTVVNLKTSEKVMVAERSAE